MTHEIVSGFTETTVEDKNRKVLAYVHDRLAGPGQCILHVDPGGEIRRVEWRSVERVEDVLEEERG